MGIQVSSFKFQVPQSESSSLPSAAFTVAFLLQLKYPRSANFNFFQTIYQLHVKHATLAGMISKTNINSKFKNPKTQENIQSVGWYSGWNFEKSGFARLLLFSRHLDAETLRLGKVLSGKYVEYTRTHICFSAYLYNLKMAYNTKCWLSSGSENRKKNSGWLPNIFHWTQSFPGFKQTNSWCEQNSFWYIFENLSDLSQMLTWDMRSSLKRSSYLAQNSFCKTLPVHLPIFTLSVGCWSTSPLILPP